jgi:integrase
MGPIGDIALAEVHPLDVQDLYASLLERDPPLSGGTVLNLHLVLHNAFGQAVRWGLIPVNPVAGAQPPRPSRPEPQAIDAGLAKRIVAAVEGSPLELPTVMALATGMRRGEILALRWSDIADGLSAAHVRRTLQSTKGGLRFEEPKTRRSRRSVALPSFLLPYLQRQKTYQQERRERLGAAWQDCDLVIDSGDGSPLSPSGLSAAWPRFLAKRGLPHVRFHDLRHAHATLMLLQGVHPKIVSERLGHASIGITLDTYSHVLPGMQGEAVNAFDQLFVSTEAAGD